MCGIFGYQIKENAIEDWQTKVLAATLGLLNDERGGHSWGIVSAEGEVKVTKGLGDIGSNLSASAIALSRSVMGHTRYASTGEVTLANAHPFDVGPIVGSHNGIVGNHHDLNIEHKRNCAVDSEHIFLHLKEGKNLNELVVWGAIQFVEKDSPEIIYLGRFPSGDLAIAGIGTYEKTLGVVWSSDKGHLEKALTLAGISYFLFNIEPTVLYEILDGDLYVGKKTLQAKKAKAFIDMPRHPKMSSMGYRTLNERIDSWNDRPWSDYVDNEALQTQDSECEACGSYSMSLSELDGMYVCSWCRESFAESEVIGLRSEGVDYEN